LVRVRDLPDEDRWGRYRGGRIEAGVRSARSFQLASASASRALNLYVPAGGLVQRHRRCEPALRRQAGVALSVVWRMAEREQAVANLRQGMLTRQEIGQAVGLLMVQRRCTAEEAFRLLQQASQRSNEKLRDVAHR
jgi:hypothetical protein